MFEKCPGSPNPRFKLKEQKCPECGEDMEMFSTDEKTQCPNCGFIIYNEIHACAAWCKYAPLCLGEETYNKIANDNGKKGI